MKPILFSIFGINVYGYGLMMAIGIISGYLLYQYRAQKIGIEKSFVLDLGIYTILSAFIGAKLLYFITIFDQLIADPLKTLKESITSGFVVYGAIIAAFLCAIIYTKKKKGECLIYLDLGGPSLALGQAFGRIGCLFAGCCYGMKTDSCIGIVFPEGGYAPTGVKLVPTQIISSILDAFNLVILLVAAKKLKYKGQVFALYLINYSVGRFLIEFFRADYRGNVWIFSTSQLISLFAFVIGMIIMFTAPKFKDNKKEHEEASDN